MKANPHGNKFQINYRCPGYKNVFYESFDSLEEANLRIAEIALLKKQGKLTPPAKALDPDENIKCYQETVTVRQLMDEYVRLHGTARWSVGTMSGNLHYINDYILPYIGDFRVKALTTRRLEHFYQNLTTKPVKHRAGHCDQNKTVSSSAIEKTHSILRNALNEAIRWGYLEGANPAMTVELPKAKKRPRDVWTADEARLALEQCTNPTLRLCMLIAIGCSMRIGEILGLTWDCVHISDELFGKNECYLQVVKELRRCDKSCLEELERSGRSDIQLSSPPQAHKKHHRSSSQVAKNREQCMENIPPQLSGCNSARSISEAVELEGSIGTEYQDYNLVIAQDNGRPYEARLIDKMFKSFLLENNLHVVVFHSLRHCSTGIKLRLSGGDIKAVQGDTGHAQANMVTDVYSHIMTDDRIRLAQNMESQFFAPIFSAPAAASSPATPEDSSVSAALQLLQNSPEMAKAFLQMAQLLSGNTSFPK